MEASRGGYWEIDHDVALNAWRKWMSDDHYILIGEFSDGGELSGIIGGQLTHDPYHFSGQLECHERMWFVREKYRKAGTGGADRRDHEANRSTYASNSVVGMDFRCSAQPWPIPPSSLDRTYRIKAESK